jgi:predicted transcriptional regulator
MKQQRKRKSPDLLKETVVGFKVTDALLSSVDREAEAEGLTRSAVIRRALIERYRETVEVA